VDGERKGGADRRFRFRQGLRNRKPDRDRPDCPAARRAAKARPRLAVIHRGHPAPRLERSRRILLYPLNNYVSGSRRPMRGNGYQIHGRLRPPRAASGFRAPARDAPGNEAAQFRPRLYRAAAASGNGFSPGYPGSVTFQEPAKTALPPLPRRPAGEAWRMSVFVDSPNAKSPCSESTNTCYPRLVPVTAPAPSPPPRSRPARL